MVERRDGDEIDLLDSGIRTAGGATVSTSLFVVSGLVYAAVTSPAVTGTYFFTTLSVALLLRPVRGVGQTLQKRGSEQGRDVAAFLGVATLFALGYLAVVGGVVVAAAPWLAAQTAFETAILLPAGVFAVSTAAGLVTDSLLGAVGYPSAQSWLNGGQSAIQLATLLLFAPAITTTGDLLYVISGVRFLTLVPVVARVGVVPRLPNGTHLRSAWSFAAWSVPDQLLDRFAYNMPVFVLGVVATPAAVGIYEAADRFADFGATVAWRLSSPVLSKVSGDASAGETAFAYLDGAITGGTGVSFLVFGYLLGAHDTVARIAFADAPDVFSITVLLVGGVNVFRGFWTLASHAIEGLDRPGVSARTKLAGLAVGTPITAVFGTESGAVAGAAGYLVVNLVIFAWVVYYTRRVVGRVPVDWPLVGVFTVGFLAAGGVTTLATRLVAGPPAPVAAIAALAAAVAFGATVGLLSARSRAAAGRAYRMVG